MASQHDTRVLAQQCAHKRGGASPCVTKLRPFATAGAVLLGAGLVVCVPPSPGHLPGFPVGRDVTLTDSSSLPDLLAPWIDQFNTASANATTLLNTFIDAPGVGLQQMIANQSGYLQDFFNDPSSSTVASISSEMQEHLAAVLQSFTLQDASSQLVKTVTEHTLEQILLHQSHYFLLGEVAGFLPLNINPAEVTQILNFLSSPESGIIMGALGPEISPLIALSNSISAGDGLNETLANMVGAFFNGADLNLDSLIPAIQDADVLPPGYGISDLDVAFGGLLSPGITVAGVGGSIFNSVGIELTGVPVIGGHLIPGEAIGPLGALEGWEQTIASLLGWDGSGSPLEGVTLPIIPTDLLDGGSAAASAAADLSTLWQDLIAAF